MLANQQKSPFPNKNYRDSITMNFNIPSLKENLFTSATVVGGGGNIKSISSIKKINANGMKNRQSNLKQFNSSVSIKKNQDFDFVKEGSNHEELIDTYQETMQNHKHKSKAVVRFRDRVSIQNRDSLMIQQQHNKISSNNPVKILNEITNQQKMEILKSIAKDKHYNLPMTSRRRAPQNIKIVSKLLNSPIQSKSATINQIKCFMCHYPQQNSILFNRSTFFQAKQRLLQIHKKHQQQQQFFFRYDAFGQFLKSLFQINYDSHQVINSFQTLLNKYTYPSAIKLMLYYVGSLLYQLNNMYQKSQQILKQMLAQIFKYKLYEYVGIYLMLMVKLKANIYQWNDAIKYLMKLLAYSWLYKFQNLQIWTYFQLSRCYFFINQQEESAYYQVRSQMSIRQPKTNIYRELVAKDYKKQVQFMRNQHKQFDFDKKISICELTKLPQASSSYLQKNKETFKLQSQIKNINEYCKIKHVKNLLSRMNSDQFQQIKTTRNHYSSSKQPISSTSSGYSTSRNIKSCRNLAGNPLLRTHQSGLKNLNVYFRSNNIRQQKNLISKNRQPKLYTFQNSNKNLLVLKQLCRNVLLQMKSIIPINANLMGDNA